MFSLEIECDADDRDLLIAELWEQGSAGVVELDVRRGARVLPTTAPSATRCSNFFPVRRTAWRNSATGCNRRANCFSRWRWRTVLSGARMARRRRAAGRFPDRGQSGMAFGTGVHETTQSCMEALEAFLKPGMSVLDVGTGSGILARAARLLGAGKVYACDTDPVAVEIAGDGFVGSVDAVAAGSCDLVVANISPEAIIELAPDLVRVLRPAACCWLAASSFRK